MARYELRVKASVAKDLRGIPHEDLQRVLARIAALQDDPRPPGAEKLSAQENYRIRQGTYRIVHQIDDQSVIVEVIKVGHRREVYR